MRIAVIDLGTNTFNLLLAKINPDHTFTTLYSGKLPAKIGEGGINQHLITALAMNRAINVLKNYTIIIEAEGGADRIIGIATSAVRTADNRNDFIAAIKEQTGIEVTVISGDEEAAYIFEGVKQAIDIGNETTITLDIGGGSNELIIADGQQIYWKHSFPLGIARVLDMFKPENPILPPTLEKVENYFWMQLEPFWIEAAKYSVKTLIGSSGSFDTYRSLLTQGNPGDALSFDIPLNDYFELHRRLADSTIEQRMQMKGMETMRAEMIVLASIFTNIVIQKLGIKRFIQSEYSLKEGFMKSIINHIQ
ncbi:MAG: hypothetical protein LBL90_09615 [Prevotellaceae bacterium]|jgi:exopolyphosphatase/guanosine-5'-triphosphate,3'-diphosphate pyrophosphatase|nr:hypothetical protein [Prevotellaceae bacterium]